MSANLSSFRRRHAVERVPCAAATLQVSQPNLETFITFDLSSLPSGTTASSLGKATLVLYVSAVTAPGSFDVYEVGGTWNELTITGTNEPVLGTLISAGVPIATANINNFVLIDVTAAVKDWLNGTVINNGLALQPNGSAVNVTFNSKESTTTSHNPQLNVTLIEPPGDITQITAGAGLVGGGTSGNVTVAVDSTQVPFLNAPNTFTGNQTVNGGLTASSFSGNGSFLSNLNPANISPGTANISVTGNAGTAVTATNALNLGGQPPSAYQPAGSYASLGANTFNGSQSVTGNVSATGSLSAGSASLTGGLTGTSASFSSTGNFRGALTAAGAVLPATGTATSGSPFSSNPLDLFASSFNGTSAVSEQFRWQAEGNGSSNTGTLNLLAATGSTPLQETGLAIAPNGQITFATGQTFPGTGSGTIAGVTAGTGLTGGGASGNVTMNLDTTRVPLLSAANSFTTSQSITGNLAVNGSVTAAGGTMSGTLNLPANGLVAGANQLVLNNGKVGIGTSTPANTLDVLGSAHVQAGQLSTTGEITLMRDDQDSVHVATQQAGSQMHFRLSRASAVSGDQDLGKDFVIGPYNYGMEMDYGGVLEINAQVLSVKGYVGDGAPGNIYLDDALDGGSLNMRGDTTGPTITATRYDNSSAGSMTFAVINATDSFKFGKCTAGCSGTTEGAGTYTTDFKLGEDAGGGASNFDVFNGSVQGRLRADSSGAVQLGSVSNHRLDFFTHGGGPQATLFSDGNLAIGNLLDQGMLSVGTAGQFQVSSTGLVTFPPGQTFPGTQSALTAGAGINISSNTISNAGVLSTIAGTGISITGTGSAPMITNTGVTAFNGRTGAVIPAANDYAFSQISGTAGASQLSGSYNINISGTANTATLATTAANASNLGGVSPTNYARVDLGNNFNGNQSVTGNVSATGSLSAGSAGLTGGLTGTTGNFSGTLTAAGTVLPATGTATSGSPFSSNPLDLFASSFNGTSAVSEQFRWQAEGNGSLDTGTLNLLAATGSTPLQETGLAIAPNGHITFAPGQTFSGTQSALTAGAGINISSNTISNAGVLSTIAGTGISISGTASAPVVTNTGVTAFNGRTGAVIPAANDFAFSQVSGTVGASQMSGSYNINISGTANTATLATTATNANNLGGVPPTNYARVDQGNNFNGNQSVTGNLSATGSISASSASLSGALTIGGGTSITQHISATAMLTFPVFSAQSCNGATISVSGAQDGDTVALGIPNALASLPGVTWTGWVSSAGLVTVRGCNVRKTATGTPPAATVRVDVWKH